MKDKCISIKSIYAAWAIALLATTSVVLALTIILFGILLAIVSVATEPFSAGETYMIWSIAGGVCGIAGLAMVFAKE